MKRVSSRAIVAASAGALLARLVPLLQAVRGYIVRRAVGAAQAELNRIDDRVLEHARLDRDALNGVLCHLGCRAIAQSSRCELPTAPVGARCPEGAC